MRSSIDEYFMNIAYVVATRSTCLRRSVGCVLVDERNHILATGYNGVVSGQLHCNYLSPICEVSMDIESMHPYACPGASMKSGDGLDMCEAVHAEQNALLQCNDVYSVNTAYCTTAPCVTCTKLLLNTSCGRIVFAEDYVQSDLSKSLCVRNHVAWSQLP